MHVGVRFVFESPRQTAGLGMRYATIGPFETIHLNAEGTREYMEKYAETIKRSDFVISLELGALTLHL